LSFKLPRGPTLRLRWTGCCGRRNDSGCPFFLSRKKGSQLSVNVHEHVPCPVHLMQSTPTSFSFFLRNFDTTFHSSSCSEFSSLVRITLRPQKIARLFWSVGLCVSPERCRSVRPTSVRSCRRGRRRRRRRRLRSPPSPESISCWHKGRQRTASRSPAQLREREERTRMSSRLMCRSSTKMIVHPLEQFFTG